MLRTLAAFASFTAFVASSLPAEYVPQRPALLDNDTVAVTRIELPPSEPAIVHTYAFPVVLVQINAAQVIVKERDLQRVGRGLGEVWFIEGGTRYSIANSGRNRAEILAIALKPDRPKAAAAPPTDAPPGITRATLIDNDQLRVVRVRFSPGAREPLHSHPNDLLTVQLTRGRVEILNGSDRSTDAREPGFVQFLRRDTQHFFASADKMPFELLSLSIK